MIHQNRNRNRNQILRNVSHDIYLKILLNTYSFSYCLCKDSRRSTRNNTSCSPTAMKRKRDKEDDDGKFSFPSWPFFPYHSLFSQMMLPSRSPRLNLLTPRRGVPLILPGPPVTHQGTPLTRRPFAMNLLRSALLTRPGPASAMNLSKSALLTRPRPSSAKNHLSKSQTRLMKKMNKKLWVSIILFSFMYYFIFSFWLVHKSYSDPASY